MLTWWSPHPDPLPNAMRRKGSGDIAYNDLCWFTNVLVKIAGSVIVVGMSRCFAKPLHVLQLPKSFGYVLN